MDDFQKYKVKGLSDSIEAEELLNSLAEAGYYQCTIDPTDFYLQIPIVYAGYIDDIEEIILDLGYEFDDND